MFVYPNWSAIIPPIKGEKTAGIIAASIIVLYADPLFNWTTDSAINESSTGLLSREEASKKTAGITKKNIENVDETKKSNKDIKNNTEPKIIKRFLFRLSDNQPKKGWMKADKRPWKPPIPSMSPNKAADGLRLKINGW